MVEIEPSERVLSGGSFAGDACQLFADDLVTEALAVGVHELALVLLEAVEHPTVPGRLIVADGLQLGQVAGERVRNVLTLGVAEGDGRVVALDLRLDPVEALVSLLAEALLVLRADEVLVDAAAAGVAAVDQSTAAPAAEDRALEIVLVLAVSFARGLVRGQHLTGPR